MIIDIACTFSATTIEAEATSISLVLTFPVTQTPSNICDEVKTCLGISESGSNTKYLNEKGLWTTPAGGGGGSVVIEATKAEFLALITADDLTYPATYKVTDVENGLFVNTLSSNTFTPDATVSLFVPDYIGGGDNLGQMDFLNIPSVGVDEYVIWGDHYWKNNTASPITPTITDEITLAGGLTQIVKASGSIYETVIFECTVDNSLNIYSITNAVYGSTWDIGTAIQQAFPSEFGYIYAPINNYVISSNLTNVRNYKGDINNGVLLAYVTGGAPNSEKLYQNFGRISGVHFIDSGNEFIGNYVDPSVGFGKGGIAGIQLVGGSRFNGNKLVGEDATILGIELWDNCQANNNELNGIKSAIWDVRTGENCQFNSNIINSNAVALSASHCGFNDVDMMQFDEVNGNEFNGDDVIVEVINMLGYSKFNNNTFNGSNVGALIENRFSGFQMLRSEITDNTFGVNNKFWKDIWMSDAKLRNATDIQIQNCTFEGIDLDLTGFTVDIIRQTIQSDKGWFAYKRNFATSPLLTNDTILHNIIPIGARITNLVISGSANGNSIQIGLSGDDESLLVLPSSLLNNQLITVSNAATANRSLLIKALTDPITTGEITVKCEFVL